MLKQKTTPGTAGGKKDFSKAKTGELKASPKGRKIIKPPSVIVMVWQPHYENTRRFNL